MAAILPMIAGAGGAAGALSTVGTVVGGVSTFLGLRSQSQAASYNAQLARRDATVAEQNRKIAVQTARIDAEDKSRESRRLLAATRAKYGATGLSMLGSPLDVLEDQASEQALDIQRIEYEGAARSREGGLQVLGYNESAELQDREAAGAATGSFLSGISSIAQGYGTQLRRTA